MKLPWRSRASDLPDWVRPPSRDRILASAEVQGGDGWLLGTRRELSLVSDTREPVIWPWQEIHRFDWDADEHALRISLIGEFGRPREQPWFRVVDAALLLQLVRERITASVVYQRHVPVRGKNGFRVIGRRNPAGGELRWMFDLDHGIDPDDPALAAATETVLAHARAEIGEPI